MSPKLLGKKKQLQGYFSSGWCLHPTLLTSHRTANPDLDLDLNLDFESGHIRRQAVRTLPLVSPTHKFKFKMKEPLWMVYMMEERPY